MAGVRTASSPIWLSATTPSTNRDSKPRIRFHYGISNSIFLTKSYIISPLSAVTCKTQSSPQAAASSSSSSSVGSAEYIEEPTTNVKFEQSVSLSGCSSSLSLIGTGYREKVFAIIGVKVYAAGLYLNQSVIDKLSPWKGRSAAELQDDSSLFHSIFQAPLEKSLQIVLVRDVDGKTFWDELDEAIAPRIKSPTSVDDSALSKFRSTFQGRPLKKGTFIFLTWLDPSKMLVCVSADGLPSTVDATIESMNVTSSLFDVFFGESPVSSTLKASVANGLAMMLR